MRNRGFSVLELLIAMSVGTIIMMGFQSVISNMLKTQNTISSNQDLLEVNALVRKVINSEKDCRLSFAGNGTETSPSSPVRFKKSSYDFGSQRIDKRTIYKTYSEGLPVSLYTGDTAGKKRISKVLGPGSVFNKVKVKNLKLVFNNGWGEYPANSNFNDTAQLVLITEKRMGTNTVESLSTFDVNVAGKTDHNRVSTLLSCNGNTTGTDARTVCVETLKGFWDPSKNPPCALMRKRSLKVSSHSHCRNSPFEKKITCPSGLKPVIAESKCYELNCYDSGNPGKCGFGSYSTYPHNGDMEIIGANNDTIRCRGVTAKVSAGSCRARHVALETVCKTELPTHEY